MIFFLISVHYLILTVSVRTLSSVSTDNREDICLPVTGAATAAKAEQSTWNIHITSTSGSPQPAWRYNPLLLVYPWETSGSDLPNNNNIEITSVPRRAYTTSLNLSIKKILHYKTRNIKHHPHCQQLDYTRQNQTSAVLWAYPPCLAEQYCSHKSTVLN